ncbi:anaerobic carbon-monoxide dehydrogenase catalytic subunit [Candidatus Contubernalis alkaliaceticus]|uniref:anaerobic carbon-monoxide dehydrogenase catalytic subunit n=1 Tax=Candidatus Contubernalis alkaliaceticus TaxID=338645 RepID=UPI001F4C4049|nr:anaerobic carbon-monoxide dehydrogenase catalytic subunit [Candidatus Contubernalis alkalaceticus]UNC93383.1 anaerobic carbon-monoxide dehydrogenase catalytic subunit [Candidatus Contubernalis alkalaceticus]
MSKKAKDFKNTSDPAALEILEQIEDKGYDTAFQRYLDQQPQCNYGSTGVCCRICLNGPCRITKKAPKGVCGATAYTIVARGIARAVAGGCSAHSDHGRHVAETLLEVAEGHAKDYKITDPDKLKRVADRVGISYEGKDDNTLAAEVAKLALEDFGTYKGVPPVWLSTTITEGRMKKFNECNILPANVNGSVVEILHQTHIGVDADPVNIIFGALKTALCDYTGMHIATDLTDVLFGTPKPVKSEANMGVIDPEMVNLVVHGHNPLLSEMVVKAAKEMKADAEAAGAKGVKCMGICCTGNEVLMRQGVPIVTSYASQELIMMTGAIDAYVVDVQCIMPGLRAVSECFHTRIITTSSISKIPGSYHIAYNEKYAMENAKDVVRTAIAAYKERKPGVVNIPKVVKDVIAGFSFEAMMDVFASVNKENPIRVLNDAIMEGQVKGVALMAGCNNLKAKQDDGHNTIAKELAKNNVFVVATGCAAQSYAKEGLLSSAAIDEYAGDGLKAFLKKLSDASGVELPLVFHMGSCVDNTRCYDLATAMANDMGVDVPRIPYVGSAPEAMSEKAVSIGSWVVALGLPCHVGVWPPIEGSPLVNDVAQLIAHDVYGGFFYFETDPNIAAEKLIYHLDYRAWKLKVQKATAEKLGTDLIHLW